jgi:hypothetical protein
MALIASASKPARSGTDALSCPPKLVEVRPAVSRYATIGEAAQKLASSVRDAPVDLKTAVKERDVSFFEVPFGYVHESVTLRANVAAVIVSRSRVVAIPGLFEVAHGLPGRRCGPVQGSQGVAIAIHGGIAHVRVLRAGVGDAPTLPSQPFSGSDEGCAASESYRIEDHFVDLVVGKHLLALRQSFVGPLYGSRAPLPGLSFEAFVVDEGGVEVNACTYGWND